MHKRIYDLKRLLSRIGLRNQEVLRIHAQFTCVLRIQCMLRIDECSKSSGLLGFGDHVKSDRCLAGGFRPVDFDNTSAWNATDTESDIKRQDTSRYDVDIHVCLGLAKAHDRSFSMRLLNLLECIFQSLFTRHRFISFIVLLCHIMYSFKVLFSSQLYENPRTFVKKNVRGFPQGIHRLF